jgi:TRAP transporter TAXI family solute receptor
MKLISILLILFVSLNAQAIENNELSNYKLMTIGTGSVDGLYYEVGRAICRIINKNIKKLGVRCAVKNSNDSPENFDDLSSKKNNFAILQSDILHDAYNGTGAYAGKTPNQSLRTIFSLYQESLTIIAKSSAGIKKFEDIKGKRVAIAVDGSGSKSLIEKLFLFYGLGKKDFANISEIDLSAQPEALCNNKIDAMVINVGHPNAAVREAAISCDIVILPLDKQVISNFISSNPSYSQAIIKGGVYPGNPTDLTTLGVSAILVTMNDMDSDVVYKITKSMIDDYAHLKALNPVFYSLDVKYMVDNYKLEPIHDGAVKYFKEIGLLSTNSK